MNEKEYKTKAAQSINEVSAKINKAKAKRESVKEDAKAEYDGALKELNAKKTGLEMRYTNLKNASEEKKEEVKVNSSSALDSFDEGWNKIKSTLTIILVLLLFVACNSANNEKKTSTDDIQNEVKDVIEVSKEYGAEKWEDLSNNIAELRNDIDANTREVEKEYNKLNDYLQKKYKDEKQEITDEKAELDRKIIAFEKASGEKKEELKTEIIQLKTALDKSISTFEKEIEKEQ